MHDLDEAASQGESQVRSTGVADDGRSGLAIRPIGPAYQQVAQQLRELIVGGELGPGARLPNETELSEMFKVSRGTVREALRVLSSQHLIRTSRGVSGGSFVAVPEPGHITDYLETSITMLAGTEMVTVEELLQARELLEIPAARLAAQHRTDDDLAALHEVVDHELELLEGNARFEERLRFHQGLLAASGNSLLLVITWPIFKVLRARFAREIESGPSWAQVAEAHREILQRVEAGDREGAAEAMRRHLLQLGELYARRMGSRGDGAG